MLTQQEYEASVAATHEERIDWWRQARFGLFIHYGLYSQLGRHEWAMALENFDKSEYEKLAGTFNPKKDCAREWCELAKSAGMKYITLTTRHHDGFSLWDSKANPYNSVNLGPKRDIVREFVEACREYGLKIGLYSSVMDWHKDFAWKCVNDEAERQKYVDYLEAINIELLSQYGKIDMLWYDTCMPLGSAEQLHSAERNQKLRALQPHILINDRSGTPEDFTTPEGCVFGRELPRDKDWEACVPYSFGALNWGYFDSEIIAPYCYSAQQIAVMLQICCSNGGNMMMNLGPKGDGSVPDEYFETFAKLGKWNERHAEVVFGRQQQGGRFLGCGYADFTRKNDKYYMWCWTWPVINGELTLAGFFTKCKSIRIVGEQGFVDFEQTDKHITLKNLPQRTPDKTLGLTIMELDFGGDVDYKWGSTYPQLHNGVELHKK